MPYFPDKDAWAHISPSTAGLNTERLNDAIAFVEAHESPWPRDLEKAGDVPGLSQFEAPPWNEPLGPFKPRGGSAGLILKSGQIVSTWGDIERVDMTFSIAKSYLALLAGVAIGDRLIGGVDDLVGDTVKGDLYTSEQNKTITWRHLLTQTSEWEGTLFDKPDLIDRNRQVGPGTDNSLKGSHRDLQKPGTFWEYNDVRVNLLGLSLLHVFKRPLPDVLRERIMDPIGASDSWSWHGYRNSWVGIDGQQMQSVPGGTHWGGGIHISSLDHARFALLVHQNGSWNGNQLLPENWCRDMHTPSDINSGYGYLWWLNTSGTEYPGTPKSSYAAIGAGTNVIWICPEDDLIAVIRWIDNDKYKEFLGKIYAALDGA